MKMVPLGEIVQINPRAPKIASDVEVNFVGMSDLDAEHARTQSDSIRPFEEVSKGYTVFADGDILVAKITPCFENNKIGRAQLHRNVGVGSTEFHVLRAGPNVHDNYLLHFLRQEHIRRQGEMRMTGSAGQRRVPPAYLHALPVPLPSLDEQRRIAAILDHADALRAKRKRANIRIGGLAESIFINMFGDPDSRSLAGRSVRFGEVAALQGGRNLVADDDKCESPYRVLKISAVTSGEFKPHESKPLPLDYRPPNDHLVRQGDLLMSRANTAELVGAVAYVDICPSNVALPDKIWRFVWRDPESVPLYYWALFRHPSIRSRISRLSSGTGGSMKNISKAKLEQLELPRTSISSQQDFARHLAAIPKPRTSDFDELFSSLQSRAFRGEL